MHKQCDQPNQPRLHLLLLTSMLVATALVGGSAALAADATEPTMVVSTATATRELLQPEVWIPGTVVSRLDSAVAAEVEGQLQNVRDIGDRVQQGDLLGQLSDAQLQIQLRNDQASLKGLATQISWLGRQLERFQTLALTQATAASELDRLTMEQTMAQHQLSAAEAQRDLTLYRISKTRILAPFAGVVVSRNRQPGEYISAGSPLLRLVNDQDLEARITAPIDVLRHVSRGQQVAVALNASSTPVMAKVRAVIPVGDERTRTAELRLSLAGTSPGAANDISSRWFTGEALRAALPSGSSQDAVTVPRDALVLRDGRVSLFLVSAEGTAHQVTVRTGDGSANRVAVSGEVSAGDRVVVRGAETLRDGQAVRVVQHLDESFASR